tara:strand:- start:354 stop:641 length:288 start_codon:yes stop_codon:yes gene_type:complete
MKDEKILKFFKKCEKFFLGNYPITTDTIGIPSLIEVFIEKKEYDLTHSIDRHLLRGAITADLHNNLYFDLDIADKLAEMYVEEKFKKYKDYIMSL